MEDLELLKEEETTNILEGEEFSELQPIIEQILDKYGYNRKTWIIILLIGLLTFTDGLIMTTFSLMIIPFQKFYSLTPIELQIISSVLFGGVAIGAILSGFISSRFYRPQIFNSSLFLIVILHLMIAFLNNIIIFGICRFLMGLILGFYIPIVTNLLAECLPIRYRSFILNFVWIGFNIGSFILSFTLLIIMPNLEANKISPVFVTFAVIHAIILLLCFFFLNDSARNFLVKNDYQRGFEILEDLHGKKLKKEHRERIIKEVKLSNNETKSSVSEIFNNKFCVTTILLAFIWFINSVVNYGPFVVSTLTMKKLGMSENIPNRQIIINTILVNIPIALFVIIGGILSEVKLTGRKGTTIICFIIGACLMTLCALIPSKFSFFLSLSLSFFTISFNVSGAYSSEVYPTKSRDIALGFLFSATRIGGFVSQILYLGLFEMNMFLPYYFTCIFAIIGTVLTVCLPYETHGVPLDIDHTH